MSASAETQEPSHILVVDDDKRLRELLRRYLSEQGFRVTIATDAADARRKLAGLDFDLLILDIMMPGESGLDLTRSLRQQKAVPILLLTAMGEADDRITGLDSGADDYLPKPFEPRELVSRVRAVLRRTPRESEAARRTVRFGPFMFDLDRRSLRQGAADVRLTGAEADLLAQLAASPGSAVSRDTLGQGTNAESRMVDVQVTRLRRKIESDPRFPRYLLTVRGRGYMLQTD